MLMSLSVVALKVKDKHTKSENLVTTKRVFWSQKKDGLEGQLLDPLIQNMSSIYRRFSRSMQLMGLGLI